MKPENHPLLVRALAFVLERKRLKRVATSALHVVVGGGEAVSKLFRRRRGRPDRR